MFAPPRARPRPGVQYLSPVTALRMAAGLERRLSAEWLVYPRAGAMMIGMRIHRRDIWRSVE